MKKPDKIKKGLECCAKSEGCPQDCPYYDVPSCGSTLKLDALAYIQLREHSFDDLSLRTSQLEGHIRDLAKMVPIRHGYWIGLEYDGYADGFPVYNLWECSECGNEHKGEDTPNYCSNCGSKMDGDVNG